MGIRSSLSDIYDAETLEVGVREGGTGGGFGRALGVLVAFGGRPLAFFVVEGLGVGATCSCALCQSSDSDSITFLRDLTVDLGNFGGGGGGTSEDSDSTDSVASFRALVDFGGATERLLFLSDWTGVAMSSSAPSSPASSTSDWALAFPLDLGVLLVFLVLLMLLVLLVLLTLRSESEPSAGALDLDRADLRDWAWRGLDSSKFTSTSISSKAPLAFFARVDLRGGFAVFSGSSSSSAVVSSFAFRFDPLALGFVTSITSLSLGSSVSATEDVALDLVVVVIRAGARAGVFVVLAARERVLLPRLSSWSSESGSGSGTLVERVRAVF